MLHNVNEVVKITGLLEDKLREAGHLDDVQSHDDKPAALLVEEHEKHLKKANKHFEAGRFVAAGAAYTRAAVTHGAARSKGRLPRR